MTSCTIGVDIGGTKTAVGVVDGAGSLTSMSVFPTPAAEGPERIVAAVAAAVRELDTAATAGTPIGVGSAGVIDGSGTVRSATNTIRDWTGFPLAAALSRELARPVVAINDVHAAAVGEASASDELRDGFLMVTVGTGVGGALYGADGLRTGATGTAGSLGHVAARGRMSRLCTCGQPGHVEAYASGPGMERTFAELTGVRASLREIAAKVGEGVPEAVKALDDGSTTLGVALADALNLLDFPTVVIGGGVSSIGPVYLDAVTAALRAAALPGPSGVRVRGARLGADASVIGAALHAAAVFGREGAAHGVLADPA